MSESFCSVTEKLIIGGKRQEEEDRGGGGGRWNAVSEENGKQKWSKGAEIQPQIKRFKRIENF